MVLLENRCDVLTTIEKGEEKWDSTHKESNLLKETRGFILPVSKVKRTNTLRPTVIVSK